MGKMLSSYVVLRCVSLWSWGWGCGHRCSFGPDASQSDFPKWTKHLYFILSMGLILWRWRRGKGPSHLESLSLEIIAKAYDTSRELWILAVAPSSIGQNFLQEGRNQNPETLHCPLCHHVNKRKLLPVKIQS